MNKTKERAKEILDLYLDEVKAFDFVKSVILVGSLSDNTYTGNAGSDIDLIHIVADETDYGFEKKQIFDLISKVEQATERDVPISKVVFQSRHLVHPYNYDFELTQENKDLLERPIEVFRALFQRYVPADKFAALFGEANEGFGVLMAATIGGPLYACGGGTITLIRE